MKPEQATVGTSVRSLREFSGVPKGTEGRIIEDYGSGVTVGWDKPDRPYPYYLPPEVVADLPAVDHRCPLRDGFDKETELEYLEVV